MNTISNCLRLTDSRMVALFCLTSLLFAPAATFGQKSNRGKNVVELDRQAKQSQDDFMQTSAELARDYEQLGELEKAKEVLQRMLRLAPDAKQIENKIKELEEQRIAGNEAIIEIDASQGWTPTKVAVRQGKTVRFESQGEFKIIFNKTLGPDGVSSEDIKTDLAAGVPLGALMGLVVNEQAKKEKDKTGEPFVIGQETEIQTDRSGQLFVKVNVPPGSRCIGQLKLKITGDVILPESSSSGRR